MPLNLDGPLTQELLKRSSQPTTEIDTAPKQGISSLAKGIYGAGAGLDAGTTLYGQHTGLVDEANPLVKWAGPAAVPVGAGMELGTVLLLKKLIGDNHPKLLNGLLMGLGGIHGALGIKNINTINQAKQQAQPTAPTETTYINPDYFGQK